MVMTKGSERTDDSLEAERGELAMDLIMASVRAHGLPPTQCAADEAAKAVALVNAMLGPPPAPTAQPDPAPAPEVELVARMRETLRLIVVRCSVLLERDGTPPPDDVLEGEAIEAVVAVAEKLERIDALLATQSFDFMSFTKREIVAARNGTPVPADPLAVEPPAPEPTPPRAAAHDDGEMPPSLPPSFDSSDDIPF